MRRKLLVLALLSYAFSTLGQDYYFKSYSVQEGLSQSNVYCGIQSNSGYLWLGTDGGVSKFNGIQFENLSRDDKIYENNATAIFEDSKNNIWFGHRSGGISLKKGDEIFVFSDTLLKNTISDIFEDKSENIWVCTRGSGVLKFNLKDNTNKLEKYTQYLGKEGLSDYVFQGLEGSEGGIWFITDLGLKKYNEKDNSFEFFKIENFPPYQITCFIEDDANNLWLGTYNGGIFKYNLKDKSLIRYTNAEGLVHNWISTVFQSHDGSIWVGTWGGGISQIKGDEITNYALESGLNDNKIRFIAEDRENNILIGTNEHGLNIFSGKRFEKFSIKHGLPSEQVWGIETLNDNIFIGTNKGLVIHNTKTKTFTNTQKELPIRSITKDSEGKIWIATMGEGVFNYYPNSGFLEYNMGVNMRINSNVNVVQADRKGNIWIGTVQGLAFYSKRDNSFKNFHGIAGLVQTNIIAIHEDKNSVLWLGTRKNGIIKYENEEFEKVAESIIHSPPTSIAEDDQGNLWFGTEGGGLYKKDEKGKFSVYRIKKGMLSDYITAVHCDENNVWAATNKGVNLINTEDNSITSYEKEDGFTSIETKLNAICQDQNGTIWFGTVDGLIKYNKEEDTKNEVTPVTMITNIKLNLQDTTLASGVVLGYNDNSLYFEFAGVCLTNPNKVNYMVKLEGWRDWKTARNNFIEYTNLPHGAYKLMIKAANNDGIWNEVPTTFAFTITPPWYLTWWFYTSCAIIGLSGFFSFVKIRERNLLKEKRVLEEKVEERTAEVVEKSNQLEHAYEDITSSIVYAQRIQNAILPTDTKIKASFPDSFVLFKPRDIVSGDFYWMEPHKETILFAAVDCTGHGVPGAFVSMVGHNLLNQSVRKKKLIKPSDILDDLNHEVQETLQKDVESSVKDGMDMALCSYNAKTMELQYSGAHNPMCLIRNGELIETKANRFGVGFKMKDHNNEFHNHTIQLQKGDKFYIYTDGFIDQFGGDKGRKFMSKKFKALLIEVSKEPFNQQKSILDKTIMDWMGKAHKQLDDILVMGFGV